MHARLVQRYVARDGLIAALSCVLDLSKHHHSTARGVLPVHYLLYKGEGGTNAFVGTFLAIQKKIAQIAFPAACAWGSLHLW